MSKQKILLVDDEPDILEIIGFNLEREGYEVFTAPNGRKALEIARKQKPDLVLLDVMMPEMDGPTTLACLRKMTQMLHTPAIFITAKVQPSEVEYLKSLGAIGVLAKPFDPMQLASQVRELWEKSIAP